LIIYSLMMFSVIMPLYNKAPYVVKAIKSVLSQTCPDFELLIMDDGSTDESFDVAKAAIKGYDNCQVFHQTNAGVSMARNNAVSLSKGDFLCFLDADDWWAPTFLEQLSRMIEEYPEAGIYGTNYIIVNETRHKTRVAPVGVETSFERGYIKYCQVYSKTMAMPLWTGAVCIPRPVYNEMRGFPKGITLGEDFLLWIRIALKYNVAFLNLPLSYYNQDSDPKWRGVGRLREPCSHMLWNLGDLEALEKTDPDYKQLIDNLRTYSLFPYFLSSQYHETARSELNKVDWTRQPDKTRRMYEMPVWYLRLRQKVLAIGSVAKQWIIKHI